MSPFRAVLFMLGIAVSYALAPPALAHPPAKLSPEQEAGTVEEVKAFRKQLAQAIAAKDVKRLKGWFADRFVFVDGTGSAIPRDAYVAALVEGRASVETAPVTDLVMRIPGGWTALLTGVSALPGGANGAMVPHRWTSVYVREGDGWKIVAGQATAIEQPTRSGAR